MIECSPFCVIIVILVTMTVMELVEEQAVVSVGHKVRVIGNKS